VYLELSRPQGDVSRWAKVYERLELLNKYHPMVCPAGQGDSRPEMDEADHKFIRAVLFGRRTSSSWASRHRSCTFHKRKTINWYAPVTDPCRELPLLRRSSRVVTARETPGTELVPRFVRHCNKEGKSHYARL
jgi:hypothetical protein